VKRIGIVVVGYSAAPTLASVLARVPDSVRAGIEAVLIGDGGDGPVTDLPFPVVQLGPDRGYGGNQKAAFRYAIDHGLDIVVLLHGDGQYAPESLAQMVAPLDGDVCDAVLGSRMIDKKAARSGGLPLYKYVGNRVLSRFENAMAGADLTEWHSGYRAYRVTALRDIDFEGDSDDFDFDTQMILQLQHARRRIVEVPIPAYDGREIGHLNGLTYAKDVAVHALRYRLRTVGFGGSHTTPAEGAYELKEGSATSHGRLLAWLRARPTSRVLDLGCSDGAFAAKLREMGHEVVGVDVVEHDLVRERTDQFFVADLDQGIPTDVGKGYDVVLFADILEHVREPHRLLTDASRCLAAGGVVLASIPNFAHWYPRGRVAIGRFDYDQRGVLDAGHLRFFTRRSFEKLVELEGYTIRRRAAVGTPFEVLQRAGWWRTVAGVLRLAEHLDVVAVALRPTLFAYQFLYELVPPPG
jgi:2-polyprenyl-3-methyl-5-hydroxy-6-metoxy-1,4-benzoquinol methylase